MEIRNLTCISCPMGCQITVEMDGSEVLSVTGNTCKRGDVYARKEVTNPTRIVTSTVKVIGGKADMVSVKTREETIVLSIRELQLHLEMLNGINYPLYQQSKIF